MFSLTIFPGCTWLERNLFSVKQAVHSIVVSIFNTDKPRLEANDFALSLQYFESDLCSLLLNLTDGSGAAELVMRAAADFNLWHQRLGHSNRKSTDLLKEQDVNRVSYDGTIPDCDGCTV